MGLDGKNMCRIAQIIKDLANSGKYVVVVSHDYEFLNRSSDKIIEISHRTGGKNLHNTFTLMI